MKWIVNIGHKVRYVLCAVKMQKYFGHVLSNRKTNKWHSQMKMPKLINNIQN